MAPEERRIAAIIFSDICDYSKIMEKDDVRLNDIELSQNGDEAMSTMEVFVKNPEHPEGEWCGVKPSRWNLIDGKWYIHIGPRPEDIENRPRLQRFLPQKPPLRPKNTQ